MKIFLAFMTAFFLVGLTGCAVKSIEQEQKIQEPTGQKISAYYYAPYMDVRTVEQDLESAGFEIVATYRTTATNETVIITNDELKAAANKPGRGFAAILRVLVDNEHNRTAVTNPVYFGKAFLQEDYDHALGLKLTEQLKSALGVLTPSVDTFPYDDIAHFQFMIGMPTYQDRYVLGENDNAVLLEKLDQYDDGNNTVFTLNFGNGRTLVGFSLDERAKSFVDKIGTQNAELLPYTILIEDNKATALKAEYYIAISYPLLSMGEFMNIASTPGAIERSLKRPFM